MANPLPVSKLGRHRFSFAKSINLDTFPVRVRRQDSTIENVMLMDEMVAFLDKEMPNTVDNYVATTVQRSFDNRGEDAGGGVG